MRLFKYLMVLLVALSIGLGLQAKGFDFTCLNCHESPAKILPKNHAKQTDFASCTTCHGAKTASLAVKVHRRHLAGQELNSDTCLGCHPQDASKKVTLSASKGVQIEAAALPALAQNMGLWLKSDKLGNVHMQHGKSCGACHTQYSEEDDDTYNAKCQGCHGNYDRMAAVKTRFTERNPHRAPHATMYPGMKCAGCHQVHSDFADKCSSCHGQRFDWKRKQKG